MAAVSKRLWVVGGRVTLEGRQLLKSGLFGEREAKSQGNRVVAGKLVRRPSQVGLTHLLLNVFNTLTELYSYLIIFILYIIIDYSYLTKYCLLLPSVERHRYVAKV